MSSANNHASNTPTTIAPHWMRWLPLSALIVVLDQLSKFYFNSRFEFAERLNVLPFFDFTLLFNTGAAFSFLANQPGWQRWFFIALSLVASLVIVWMLKRHAHSNRFSIALVLILGGAIGNLIDRIAYGHVIDFLLFYWQNWYYPAFNVADIAITCGAGLLIVDEIQNYRQQRLKARSQQGSATDA